MAQDPLAPARRLLAELDAETRQAEAHLQALVKEGGDHFRQVHQDALPHLTPDNVETWSAQAGALASLEDLHG